MTFPFPLLHTLTAAPPSYFYALANGANTDISDDGNIQSGGTFTIPAAWNGRKIRAIAGNYNSIGADSFIESLLGGVSFPGAGKYHVDNVTLNEGGVSVSALIAVTTGQQFTFGGTFTSGSGNWKQIELAPAGVKGALVNRITSTFAIGTSATSIQWNNEVYDTDGYHDNSVNPSRLTYLGAGGLVRVTASVEVDAAATDLFLQVYKNNALLAHPVIAKNAGNFICISSPPIPMATNDYIEIRAHTTTASNLQISDHSWACIEELDSGLKYAVARATGSTSISASDNLNTPINCQTEDADVGGWFTPTDNKFVVPSGVSKVRMGFNTRKTSNSGALRTAIYKNGAAFANMLAATGTGAGTDYAHGMSGIIDCAPGDTFDFRAGSAAGATSVLALSNFWIEEVLSTA